ncbi:MAG: hypothetical protein AAFQ94_24830 [Bacteroidota bacterium]
MHNIKDLNIDKELLPLFDFSLNSFTRAQIIELLNSPLESISAIRQRQQIYQGFIANMKVLQDYSYPVLYLKEVHFFLENSAIEDLSEKKISYRLFTAKSDKTRYQNRFTQVIVLFHRLYTHYFSRCSMKPFPEHYKPVIKRIVQFLQSFETAKYEHIIREKVLKDQHIIELTKKVVTLKTDGLIRQFWEDLFLFEAYLSISQAIVKYQFTFPEFTEDQIKITEFYHPLLENPIKNSLESAGNVIVLNGPNMSGKSTLLKALGLCVYLGHLGIAIPASGAEIPFFGYFSIAINKRDDVLKGYSHFMTEVVNLKSVAENASRGIKCFAVFDELFSGTNVEDAFEICQTTISGLSKFEKSFFLISTHIQQLKDVANEQIENYYIDCELIDKQPVFTYRLEKGWSDIKVGRILFDKEGLNDLLK